MTDQITYSDMMTRLSSYADAVDGDLVQELAPQGRPVNEARLDTSRSIAECAADAAAAQQAFAVAVQAIRDDTALDKAAVERIDAKNNLALESANPAVRAAAAELLTAACEAFAEFERQHAAAIRARMAAERALTIAETNANIASRPTDPDRAAEHARLTAELEALYPDYLDAVAAYAAEEQEWEELSYRVWAKPVRGTNTANSDPELTSISSELRDRVGDLNDKIRPAARALHDLVELDDAIRTAEELSAQAQTADPDVLADAALSKKHYPELESYHKRVVEGHRTAQRILGEASGDAQKLKAAEEYAALMASDLRTVCAAGAASDVTDDPLTLDAAALKKRTALLTVASGFPSGKDAPMMQFSKQKRDAAAGGGVEYFQPKTGAGMALMPYDTAVEKEGRVTVLVGMGRHTMTRHTSGHIRPAGVHNGVLLAVVS
ncbi:MAG: hypothetical protein KDB26_12030 [Microthrixaceae bacterium]|nr:hypothetical protein [Microthrixaceae bacterium]